MFQIVLNMSHLFILTFLGTNSADVPLSYKQTAWQSVLKSLDHVQNAALCTCLVTSFKPIRVEAGELPLELWRQQLCLQYIF